MNWAYPLPWDIKGTLRPFIGGPSWMVLWVGRPTRLTRCAERASVRATCQPSWQTDRHDVLVAVMPVLQ